MKSKQKKINLEVIKLKSFVTMIENNQTVKSGGGGSAQPMCIDEDYSVFGETATSFY